MFLKLPFPRRLSPASAGRDRKTGVFAQAGNFAFLLFALSLPFLLWIEHLSPPGEGGLASFYKASIPAYFALLLILANFLVAPLNLLPPRGWPHALLGSAWLIFLVADAVVFNAYKFHINLFLIQFFFVDFKDMGLPAAMIAIAAGVLLALVGFAIYLSRLAARPPRWLRVASLLLLLATPPVFLVNQSIHTWADTYRRDEITRYTSYFPAYFPIGSRKSGERLSQLLPGLFPPEAKTNDLEISHGFRHIHYPLSRPSNCKPDSDANILFLVLESWQAAALTAEVMPNLEAMSHAAWRFNRHISGGNATVPGLFSLMFGLHASYYDSFRASPQNNPSLFTQTLGTLGYQTNVFASVDLQRFSLRALFFPGLPEANYHQFNDRGSFWAADRASIDYLLTSLDDKTRQATPHFDFVFLTSSHFSYEYPDEFRKFTPVPLREGANLLNKNTDPAPVLNDYHNSLNYEDALLGEVFEKLRRTGLWDKTWIVVLGDHAEEFNENGKGYWGHGSNFTRWQTQTPLLIKRPHQTEGAVRDTLSTHQDIVPTLMEEALHCGGPSDNYANGVNLFGTTGKAGTVIASYVSSAYWIDGSIVDKLSLGSGYAWEDLKQTRPTPPADRIRQLIREESRFLQ